MNYVQAMSDFLNTGSASQGVVFESSLKQGLENDRKALEVDGMTLHIEALENVIEIIVELEEGGKAIKYEGLFIHAFKKDGLLQPTPVSEPFSNQDDAKERGEMIFIVDTSGAVVTWYNSLTGNTEGQKLSKIQWPGSKTASDSKHNFMVWMFGIAITILFMGWFYVSYF
jgi:hypothetical protein